MRSRLSALACLAALAACSGNGDGPAEDARSSSDLQPRFPPLQAGAGATTGPVTEAPSATDVAPATDARTPSPRPTTTPTTQTPAGATSATITDPVGDATPSVDPPPAYADLAGGTLIRTSEGFELRVRLGGGQAPARAQDGDHTMNIASFYDVDGDGSLDYEVWANLSINGWGGSYFDLRAGRARYKDNAGVTWTPEGDSIVMRFPLSHLANAETFRWSLASEWGRYEVLTTPATARDDAPDNDQAVNFPG